MMKQSLNKDMDLLCMSFEVDYANYTVIFYHKLVFTKDSYHSNYNLRYVCRRWQIKDKTDLDKKSLFITRNVEQPMKTKQ